MTFQSAFRADQIAAYNAYVKLPAKYHLSARPTLDLALLTALHVHQIARIPYDNLALHYSQTKKLSLVPQDLFAKLTRNGRGGYCMENTVFFKHVLRAYGFNVYATGARIRLRQGGVPMGDYQGWTHSVCIVTLSTGERYVCDICFGGDGATQPLPLTDALPPPITQNLGTQELRLLRDFIPHQTSRADASARMWIYQYRNAVDAEWNSFYAFADRLEFLEQDFTVMSYFTSSSPLSFLTYNVVLVKFMLDEGAGDDGEGRIKGKVVLFNGDVKVNEGGTNRLAVSCKTEEERIAAMREYFDLNLTEEEREGIRGYVTELKG